MLGSTVWALALGVHGWYVEGIWAGNRLTMGTQGVKVCVKYGYHSSSSLFQVTTEAIM